MVSLREGWDSDLEWKESKLRDMEFIRLDNELDVEERVNTQASYVDSMKCHWFLWAIIFGTWWVSCWRTFVPSYLRGSKKNKINRIE